jgi:hypothetical protein
MELLKEKRFWAAFGLGLALCALVPLSIQSISPGHESLWERYLLPWLVRTLLGGIVLLVALITAIKVRPRRPERLAAAAGFIGSGFSLGAFLYGSAGFYTGNYLNEIIRFVQSFFQILPNSDAPVRSALPMLFSSFSIFLLPLAVICWLAANYWRMDSWGQFWRGPGGAILRGGIVAGLILLPVSVMLALYNHAVLIPQYIRQLPETAIKFHQARPFSWGQHSIMGLNGIVSGAMITAFLVSLRPKPILGAFAGSGLALIMACVFFILMKLPGQAPFQPQNLMLALLALKNVLLAAIAGSFAGRWSEIEIAKEE